MKFILGRKVGMTRVFDDEGRHIAVTKIAALPAEIAQIKTKESDGYKAVKVRTFKSSDKKKVVKESEFSVDNPGRYKVGEAVALKQFKKDELVTVQGTSKGKGFAGTIKRHGFSRGPETHGSNNVREPGSIGGGYPQRVVLGRRMPGHMGHGTITIQNLRIVDIEDDMMLIAGAIPGPVKGIVRVWGMGEKVEEEIDYVALEEERAKQAMLEAEKEEKAEEDKGESEEQVEKREE